eukprot:542855-Prorocentrum_minimum.AAC.1
MADDLNTLRVWLSWRVGVGVGGARWSSMRSDSAAERLPPRSPPRSLLRQHHAPASAFVYTPAFCANAFAHISVHLPPTFALAFISASLHPRLGLPSYIHACVCVH